METPAWASVTVNIQAAFQSGRFHDFADSPLSVEVADQCPSESFGF
jgi:hypothetical protein